MSQPFRFVHASDFHLGRPLAGVADPPPHLLDTMLDAPYVAARRAFDLAINQRADFLILAGDVVNVARTGPRAVAFLLDQFERLAAARVAVYWIGGRSERRAAWPAELLLPPNVHVWAAGPLQAVVHQADGDPLAVLVSRNRGRQSETRREPLPKLPGNLFTIGIIHGRLTERGLAKSGIDYWACGGSHRRRRLRVGSVPVVYSGTPQGRAPAEHGTHGAVVVNVDEHGAAHPRFVATDSARYLRLRETIDLASPRSEQERALGERLDALRTRAAGTDLLLSWNLVPSGVSVATGAANAQAAVSSRAAWAAEWLAWLRREFGASSPALWSVAVEVENPAPAAVPEGAPQEGSLLADFLAEAAACAESNAELPIEEMLSAPLRESALASLLQITGGRRRQVLRQAITLGGELLGAEESSPR